MVSDGADPARDKFGALAACIVQGGRSALLLRPRALPATPSLAVFALLLAALLAVSVAAQRWLIDGPAVFEPAALHTGWLATLIALGLCWFVGERSWGAPPRPGPSALFGILLGQQLVISLVVSALLVPFYRSPTASDALPPEWSWLLYLAPVAWMAVAEVVLLLRHAPPRWAVRAGVPLVVALAAAFESLVEPPALWIPAGDGQESAGATIDEETLLAQPRLIDEALEGLKPQRPGVVDVYSITFAPYAGEEVFRRESAMVDAVMRERFDAEGRSLQLVNNAGTTATLPWASATHLQQAIAAVADLMDPDEDVLFIHLTSHGGRDGVLATEMPPLAFDAIDAVTLRGWLDDAQIRYRIVSVSACFSGSWIAPLAEESTLVMTAADADHTSYGCGRRSDLTFFGRAMYDEALRRGWSFEEAHATAREVIARREREAGKDDGYSNPQISLGSAIRPLLQRLQQRLSTMPRTSASGPT